jgi:hypothetical protein
LNNVNFNVDKTFQWTNSEIQKSFIEENAIITAEVDSDKRMDVSVLELREGVCLMKEGDGVLKIADVPYSLDLKGGSVEFVENTRTSMGTLKIGADCSYSLDHANMTIETLEDNAGTITIEKPGLSIAALGENASLSGTFAFETAAFSKGDTLVTTPNAQLRAKIKADAEEPFKLFSNGKYAHQTCFELEQTRELTDQEKLEKYIMQLFGSDYVYAKVKKQIKDYVTNHGYTYSGIHKALIYYYEVKGNKFDEGKAQGGIGIIPYVYQHAFNYYYAIWEAQQKQEHIHDASSLEEYIPRVVEVRIPVPKRQEKKRVLFGFLDEEESD